MSVYKESFRHDTVDALLWAFPLKCDLYFLIISLEPLEA